MSHIAALRCPDIANLVRALRIPGVHWTVESGSESWVIPQNSFDSNVRWI